MKKQHVLSALLSAAVLLTGLAPMAAAASKCPVGVDYALGYNGVSEDLTAESVTPGKSPKDVPEVTALNGYEFQGWSLQDPAKLKEGEEPKLVDPAKVEIEEATTFYAVYSLGEHTTADHKHFVIGYPDGTFGPADPITRGSVATIIARACLEDFQEGADYGNPGQYTDVEENWAYSAVSFCTVNDVFKGYDDGTFRPNQPITRQEFALVIARLAGLKANEGMPFTDQAEIGSWAVDGVYTAYANGWVNGYTDGTFQPLADIRRDEAVKIFNGYLHRGVDAEGLKELTAFVYQSDGQHAAHDNDRTDQYLVWPDVPQSQWAYYEIVEAANDHTFYYPDEDKKDPPEHWTAAFIDEVWNYHDQENQKN